MLAPKPRWQGQAAERWTATNTRLHRVRGWCTVGMMEIKKLLLTAGSQHVRLESQTAQILGHSQQQVTCWIGGWQMN